MSAEREGGVMQAGRHGRMLLEMYGPERMREILAGYIAGYAAVLAGIAGPVVASEECYRVADAEAVSDRIDIRDLVKRRPD